MTSILPTRRAGHRHNLVLFFFCVMTLVLSAVAHPVQTDTSLDQRDEPRLSYVSQLPSLGQIELEKRAPKTKSTPAEASKTHPASSVKSSEAPQKLPSTVEINKLFKLPAGRTTPLFWSGVQGDIPTIRAKFPKIIMDVDCYPPEYAHTYDKNPKLTLKFQKRYSEVFARNVPGPDALVLVPWQTGPNPKRVFHSAEWPVLKQRLAKGQIKNIWQLNPDNLDERRRYEPGKYYKGLGKRLNIDPDGAPWDVNLDALAEVYEAQQSKQSYNSTAI